MEIRNEHLIGQRPACNGSWIDIMPWSSANGIASASSEAQRLRPSSEAQRLRRRVMLCGGAALAYIAFGFLSEDGGGTVLVAVFLASLAGSIGGVAFSALCGPVLFWLGLDPVRAVQIMMACSIANQLVMTWSVRGAIDWRTLGPFLLGGGLGLPLGLWLLLHADHRLYCHIFGALLLAYGCCMLIRAPATLRVQRRSFDLVAGVLGGMTGAAGAFPSGPVAIWCSFKGWNKLQQRAVFQPFIVIMQVASLLAISIITGRRPVAPDGFALHDLACVPAGLLGTFIGLAVFRHLSTRHFFLALHLLLAASGISFLV